MSGSSLFAKTVIRIAVPVVVAGAAVGVAMAKSPTQSECPFVVAGVGEGTAISETAETAIEAVFKGTIESGLLSTANVTPGVGDHTYVYEFTDSSRVFVEQQENGSFIVTGFVTRGGDLDSKD